MANAINLIDGYNGLAAMVSAGIALCLGFVGYLLGDSFMVVSCLASLAGALFWFFSCGISHLDGFSLGMAGLFCRFSIGRVVCVVGSQASTCFCMVSDAAVIFYPVFETLFTIVRRVSVHGGSPGHPDACHCQMLYKRAVRWYVGSKDPYHRALRNAMTSPYLWALWLVSAVPAMLFWRFSMLLLASCVMFALVYLSGCIVVLHVGRRQSG